VSRPTCIELLTASPSETLAMAAAFAGMCRPNDVIALEGPLGAGKTCFTKGLARGLGVPDERAVVSPSFVLMRRYRGRLTLYHFDAYRLAGPEEMEDIGCAEAFEAGGVSVVEWADRVAGCLPPEHFSLEIAIAGRSRRRFSLVAHGGGPQGRLPRFVAALAAWSA